MPGNERSGVFRGAKRKDKRNWNGKRKLILKEVQYILSLKCRHLSRKQIAQRYFMTVGSINRIIRKKRQNTVRDKEICGLRCDCPTSSELAIKYGVLYNAIFNLRARKTWKNVTYKQKS